jgi:hypothetical protein
MILGQIISSLRGAMATKQSSLLPSLWIASGSENSGRPSMGLEIENFTDDKSRLQG